MPAAEAEIAAAAAAAAAEAAAAATAATVPAVRYGIMQQRQFGGGAGEDAKARTRKLFRGVS